VRKSRPKLNTSGRPGSSSPLARRGLSRRGPETAADVQQIPASNSISPATGVKLDTMIGSDAEPAISLRAALDLPEMQRDGRPLHVSRIYFYADHGIDGIRLETINQFGRRCTSRAAVQRFIRALTSRTNSPAIVQSADVQRRHRDAEKFLDTIGV
jgi:hypothetical protein